MKFIKVRKKPVEVEAFQLTEQMLDQTLKLDERKTIFEFNGRDLDCNKFIFFIDTLEGEMQADVGDYIIKGIRGELYPCRKDIFEETYDIIEQ